MNSKQIECFITVAEHQSFSQASKILYLTQSVVSYQVSTLEKELGFPLFVRDTHNVALTKAGEQFLHAIVKLKEMYSSSVEQARELYRMGDNTLKIGWQVYEAERIMGVMISTCQQRLPGIQVELMSQKDSDYLDDLLCMRKDLVLMYEENVRPDPRVKFVPLWPVTNYFVMNIANPLAKKEHLDVEDMEGQVIFIPQFMTEPRTITCVYQDILKRFPTAEVRMSTDFEFKAIAYVIANRGIALYPFSYDFPEFGVVSRPFSHCEPLVMGLAFRANDQSKKTTTTISITKEIFDSLTN